MISSKNEPPPHPRGPVVEHLPVDAGDTGSVLVLGRSHMLWGD